MLELPEVLSRVRELNENIVGKMVKSVHLTNFAGLMAKLNHIMIF